MTSPLRSVFGRLFGQLVASSSHHDSPSSQPVPFRLTTRTFFLSKKVHSL